MPKMKINFIDAEHNIKASVTVYAFNKNEAFAKAEEFYRVHNMKFKYTDMYIDSMG